MQFEINVEDIRERGLDYERELPQAFLESALTDEIQSSYHAVAPGRIRGHFERLSGRVLAQGHIELTVKAQCKRCLAEVVRVNPVDFQLTFVHGPAESEAPAEEGHGSFDGDDADTEPFDGETIGLDPLIREEILLNLPMDVLCRAECKGLCSICGQDLNERECGHDRKMPDTRWAALKGIKLPN